MKKLISILLVVALLLGVGAVAASATAPAAPAHTQVVQQNWWQDLLPPPPSNDPVFNLIMNLLFAFTGDFSDAQVANFISILRIAQASGLDIQPVLEWANPILPIRVRAALHNDPVLNASYPLWQRNAFIYYTLRIFFFGWIWMRWAV